MNRILDASCVLELKTNTSTTKHTFRTKKELLDWWETTKLTHCEIGQVIKANYYEIKLINKKELEL